uniref:Uncharacterized protein n=1 Tax=Anguilla anguilla TaxID=7936 RepID=A0A0E9UAN1_ANGAN
MLCVDKHCARYIFWLQLSILKYHLHFFTKIDLLNVCITG